MTSLPIHWIRARVYGHATEDEERVMRALETACPGGVDRREVLEGQYGNPILQVARRLEDRGGIRKAWQAWRAAGLVAAVRPDLDARTDEEGVLHFRIDKQQACGGVLALAHDEDSIDIQVKLETYPTRPEEIRRVAAALVAEAP